MFKLYMKHPLEKKPDEPLEARKEPPVVARLVVEIRSDGTHIIARGMAEEEGERVQIEAEGRSPLEFALALIKALREVPSLTRTFARGFLPGRKK
ncbi:MAG: hypothetical protein E6J78_14230 [Deltaproteobacteria bacterium]|nr:MAG: hypothetical protein E6J78_14230 [Deltaproteobacteria bacterium]